MRDVNSPEFYGIPGVRKALSRPGCAIVFASLVLTMAANANGNGSMDPEMQEIEKIRTAHEMEIMDTDGVVMVSTGLGRDGKPCLKIGTRVPPETVRDKLPKSIFRVCVEIDFVGDIEAQ
jgi:hypothetical protein